jgi:hypothetical protein
MGRYYTGQISGKFWFGIQNSDDATYFGKEPDEVYTFYVCSCELHIEDIDKENKESIYCENCYDSFEEHRNDMKDNEYDDTQTWHLSESEIRYSFQESDKEIVQQKIQELEDIVGNYMDSYTIIENDMEIEYEFTVPKNVPNEQIPLLAKLCLGKQIAYCLEKTGSCSFSAEL